MHAFSQAAFLRAAGRPQDLLTPGPAELAFAGRSNVGKSSAINALCGRRALARTSKTPGRTQTVNFYDLGAMGRLADLPGYGYARVSQALRSQWRELVGRYLERPTLAGIVVVMDARHPLMPLDRQLIDWLHGRRMLALLSKADKLGRVEQRKLLDAAQAALAPRAGETHVALFSSVSRQGVDEVRGLLERWLREAAQDGEQAAGIKGPR